MSYRSQVSVSNGISGEYMSYLFAVGVRSYDLLYLVFGRFWTLLPGKAVQFFLDRNTFVLDLVLSWLSVPSRAQYDSTAQRNVFVLGRNIGRPCTLRLCSKG